MTFKESEIEKVVIDIDEEWTYDEDKELVCVKFYGLEDYVERFFNFTREELDNSWIDCYAYINRNEKRVINLEFVFVPNEPGMFTRELLAALVPYEGNLFYYYLKKSSKGGLQEFLI